MKAVALGAGDAHTRDPQQQRALKLGALAGELSRREVLRARPAPPAFTNHLLNLKSFHTTTELARVTSRVYSLL